MCPGCARTFAHKTFFDNHVSLCGTGNESEPEEEPEDEPPEDEPEEQPEEQPEDEPRIVPFYDQSDRSSLAVPSHEALGSISPSLQAEVAAVEKFVTEHCAEIIAGITHGEAPMYEPVRAHAEALRNLERTSCLLVVSTVPAVYNCFIAIELPAHLGGWRRPVRFGLWSQWLTWLGGVCSVEESDSAGVAVLVLVPPLLALCRSRVSCHPLALKFRVGRRFLGPQLIGHFSPVCRSFVVNGLDLAR